MAVKKASAYKVVKRRNGRFAVRKRGGGLVHGDEKTKVLQDQGKVKVLKAKPKAEGDSAPA